MAGTIMRLVQRLAAPLAVAVSLACPLQAYADVPTMAEQDLQAAIAQAAEGETVTLTGDVVLSNSLKVNTSIKLDLGGYTIRYESKLAANSFDPALRLSADNIQVTNGAIESNNVSVYVDGAGQTVLSGCVITTTSAKKEALELSRSVSGGDGLITIENTEINAGDGGIAISKDYQDAGNGIRFTGDNRVSGRVKCVFNGSNGNAVVSVEGGAYNSGANQCFYNGNTFAGDAELAKHLRIVKGQFTTKPLDAFVDPGSACVEGAAEYPFFIAPSGQTGEAYLKAADGSRTFYDTVELAVAAAQAAPVYIARSAHIDDVTALKGAQLVGASGASLSVDAPLAQLLPQVASLENVAVVCNDASLSAASGTAGALVAGTFGNTPTDALLSLVGEGYLVADDAESEPNKILPQSAFEARVGRIGYALLVSAVTDSTSGDAKNQVVEQIDLLRDVTSQSDVLGVFLPKSAFVLNLNGKSLTSGPNASAVLLSALSSSTQGPDGARITIKNGTLNGGSFGVATNGTLRDVVLKLENVDVRANEQSGVAAYLAAGGSTTITGGSYRGALGIQLCAGGLLVDGTSITALGQPAQKAEGDGPIMDGAAISIVDRDGYGAIGTVEIVGGEFGAAAGLPAIKAYHFDNNDKQEESWADAGEAIEISGGTFSAVPENMGELCAPGFGLVTLPDGTQGLHQHQIEHAAETNSTCVTQGHTEYWWCSVEGCGKFYADAGATQELTHEQVLKPLAAHVLEHIAPQSPTASEDGCREHWKCSVCGALFLDKDAKKPAELDELRVPATGEPEALTHEVTFVFGVGDELVVDVVDGQTVARPDDPSYAGWVFTGWYRTRNADGTVADPYDFSTPVTDDMTLYGGWIKRDTSVDSQKEPASDNAVASPLPQTGDDSLLPMVAVGAIGVVAVVLGVVMARKRK